MNIYLLSQSVNNDWDTYNSFVVCEETEEEAKHISPSEFDFWHNNAWYFTFTDGHIEDEPTGGHTWAHPDDVTVKYLGIADNSLKKGEIVCSSFNAG